MQASVEQQNQILQLQFIDDEIMQANTKLTASIAIQVLIKVNKPQFPQQVHV
jgi:hypothetical protein